MVSHKISLCAGAGLLVAFAGTAPTWTAKLSPTAGSGVSGTATVEAKAMSMPMKPDSSTKNSGYSSSSTGMGSDSASASISISGAKAGEYPWHIHSGRCGQEGPAVGGDAPYPILKVGSTGSATAQATVAFKPAPGTDYSVNVHKSKTDKTVISCGGLQQPGQPMDSMMTPTPPPRDTTAPRP
jgi:hypothetical protein